MLLASNAAAVRAGLTFRPVADTIRSFKEIVDGKHDDLPEQAFYMQGTIDEVLQRAEELNKS